MAPILPEQPRSLVRLGRLGTVGLLLLPLLAQLGCSLCRGRGGDDPALVFAGRRWIVRDSATLAEPGPNRFSSDRRDVWVDGNGALHLRIAQREGRWWSTEVFSEEPMGYGTYSVVLGPGTAKLDRNVVLGLFTWSDESFQTEANSEIDVELARWGDEGQAHNLHYAVQPLTGPDSKQTYAQRSQRVVAPLSEVGSLHVWNWSAAGVEVASWATPNGAGIPVARWAFDGNPAARKQGPGGISSPVGVPRPSPGSRMHFNLWLYDADRDGQAEAPSDGREVEIVVRAFTFIGEVPAVPPGTAGAAR